MKNIIITVLIVLLIFIEYLCLCFYARGERIKQVVNYDIKKEHLIMQESGNYNYCPYCGEYIAESEEP